VKKYLKVSDIFAAAGHTKCLRNNDIVSIVITFLISIYMPILIGDPHILGGWEGGGLYFKSLQDHHLFLNLFTFFVFTVLKSMGNEKYVFLN